MVDKPAAKCTVICSATGTGKSFIMREIVKRYKGRRIIIIVPGVALSWATLKEVNKVPDCYFKHYRSLGFGKKRKKRQ